MRSTKHKYLEHVSSWIPTNQIRIMQTFKGYLGGMTRF